MTYDVGYFKEVDRPYISKVNIGNGECVDIKGKGVVTIDTSSCTKSISYVFTCTSNILRPFKFGTNA